jgi:hypothetical protein
MMHIANDNKITASYHEHGMQWHAEQVTQCVSKWSNWDIVQWVEYHCKGIMNAHMELMMHAASADSSDARDVVVNFCENDVA